MKLSSAALFCGLAVLGGFSTACGKKIGDDCKTSFDCNPNSSDRTCDIAQPGGYCTIVGCDEHSCPDGSECIRFFPRLYLTTTCDPAQPSAQSPCGADELCIPGGKCAPRASERRYCADSCGGNGDCRGDYECREAGTLGSIALTKNPDKKVRFCAPEAQ